MKVYLVIIYGEEISRKIFLHEKDADECMTMYRCHTVKKEIELNLCFLLEEDEIRDVAFNWTDFPTRLDEGWTKVWMK